MKYICWHCRSVCRYHTGVVYVQDCVICKRWDSVTCLVYLVMFRSLRQLFITGGSPVQPAVVRGVSNADRMDCSVYKFKMSTVKFPSVQFGCAGIRLQFSRQCLMGYIHHYWVIARSSRVLRQRERGSEKGRKGGSQSEWVRRRKRVDLLRWNYSQKRENVT